MYHLADLKIEINTFHDFLRNPCSGMITLKNQMLGTHQHFIILRALHFFPSQRLFPIFSPCPMTLRKHFMGKWCISNHALLDDLFRNDCVNWNFVDPKSQKQSNKQTSPNLKHPGFREKSPFVQTQGWRTASLMWNISWTVSGGQTFTQAEKSWEPPAQQFEKVAAPTLRVLAPCKIICEWDTEMNQMSFSYQWGILPRICSDVGHSPQIQICYSLDLHCCSICLWQKSDAYWHFWLF